MADQGKAYTQRKGYSNGELYSWPAMATGDVGQWVYSHSFGDRCVTCIGTFGGASVSWEGTNDDPNDPVAPTAFPLHDVFGNLLTTASGEGKSVLQTPLAMRPKVTGGSAVSVTPQMFARRTQR